MTKNGRPLLRETALRYGILAGYEGSDGMWRDTSDETREALLAAMGIDASTETAAARALADAPREDGADETPDADRSGCLGIDEVIGEHRCFGLTTNLYTLRSRANWGSGDLSDLRRLADWAANVGASFVGINPLNALDERRPDGNPYFPISRLFLQWTYLDIESVPELEHCPAAKSKLDNDEGRRSLAALRRADRVDWRRITEIKREAMDLLDQCRSPSRDDELARFRVAQGDALTDFATYSAIAEHLDVGDWRRWPAELRSPTSAGVARFRETHARRVDFHCYLQMETDRQLGVAAEAAAALDLGIYGDLPVGVAPGGSDTWAFPDAFVRGATIGAPPDPYATAGQNWGLAPLSPLALGRDPASYWRPMLDSNTRHCGALRIDHAMGLVRQFWIPEGRPASEGAYVSYPTGRLLPSLAAASREQRCVVIAEDLGTIPMGFRELLARWKILRLQILPFEWTGDELTPPGSYEREAFAAVNTHDLCPLEGFWRGTDLAMRADLGAIDADELEALRCERERERAALRRALRRNGLVGDGWEPAPGELAVLANALVARAPSRLLGVSLDDLAGETVPINIPSAGAFAGAFWSRRMHRSLEEMQGEPTVIQTLARIREERSFLDEEAT